MFLRVLELIFFLYFATHIPITLFIDLQALLPEHVYPPAVSSHSSFKGLEVFLHAVYALKPQEVFVLLQFSQPNSPLHCS